MNRKLISGLGATLAVLALAISPVAHALIIQGAKDSVTYAKETLPTAGSISKDGVTHYAIGHALTITAPAGIAGQSGDRYFVTFTLDGMVLAAAAPTNLTEGNMTISTGGAKGDKSVTYRAGGAVNATDTLSANWTFAVSAAGGSITRTIVNRELEGTAGKHTESHTGRINVASALKETVTTADPVMAKADHDFMAFGGTAANPVLKAKFGKLEIGLVTGMAGQTPTTGDSAVAGRADTRPRHAGDTSVASGTEAVSVGGANGMADRLVEIMDGLDAEDTNKSTATVAGDVSFVKKIGFVNIADTADCPAAASITDIRKAATAPATGYTNEFKALLVNGNEFMSSGSDDDLNRVQTLCLEADGKTAIPAGAYTITTSYARLTASAFAPEGATHTLGTIVRDGVAVHIPYLTTHEGYRQRLILRNRGNRTVTYTISFATEMDVTASPMSISGELAAGQVKTLRIQDMVELTGATRTAATVTSNAANGTLDVATTLVNVEDRSTDTIRY